MEDKKVVISVDDLRYKIKGIVENCRNEIKEVLDDAEEYIRVAHVIEEENTPKFKVGDVLTGIKDNHYFITTSASVLLVTDIVSVDRIRVKVMDHKLCPDEVGEGYEVDPEQFKLITDIL